MTCTHNTCDGSGMVPVVYFNNHAPSNVSINYLYTALEGGAVPEIRTMLCGCRVDQMEADMVESFEQGRSKSMEINWEKIHFIRYNIAFPQGQFIINNIKYNYASDLLLAISCFKKYDGLRFTDPVQQQACIDVLKTERELLNKYVGISDKH